VNKDHAADDQGASRHLDRARGLAKEKPREEDREENLGQTDE